MDLEQRKISIINWITTLSSEKLVEALEKIRKEDVSLPSEILHLLNESANSKNFTQHTSTKDLL